jgi:pSer/pThr/pTyr-binding forkhead associated (FHA) protein
MTSLPGPARSADQNPSSGGALRLRLSLKGQPVQTFRFDQDAVMVGRDPYCDVYVDNPGVSRQHLRIERSAPGEFRVMDMESANGTFLNNQPVQISALRHGDTIQFGKYGLEVEIESEDGARGAARRRPAPESDGATVLLSPAEIRQMVARTREPVPVPDLKLVPGTGRAAASPAPAPPVTSSGPKLLWIGIAAFVALAAGGALALWWWMSR